MHAGYQRRVLSSNSAEIVTPHEEAISLTIEDAIVVPGGLTHSFTMSADRAG